MAERSPKRPQCPATNAEGLPCRAQVNPGKEWCFWHDPGIDPEVRAEARSRGGKTLHQRAALARLAESLAPLDDDTALQLLELATVAVLAGTLQPAAGIAASSLLRTRLALLSFSRDNPSAELAAGIRQLHNAATLGQTARRYGKTLEPSS